MGSNLAFSLRGVLTKRAGASPSRGVNMDVANRFAVMSALAFLAVLPCALLLEGPRLSSAWQAALETGVYTQVRLPYLTLPYLTVPYRTLPYLTVPYLTLPYLTLQWDAAAGG